MATHNVIHKNRGVKTKILLSQRYLIHFTWYQIEVYTFFTHCSDILKLNTMNENNRNERKIAEKKLRWCTNHQYLSCLLSFTTEYSTKLMLRHVIFSEWEKFAYTAIYPHIDQETSSFRHPFSE